MNNEKYVTWKNHQKISYSTIYGKEIYPVAINPIYVKDLCVHEINIKRNEHIGRNSKYDFKDITFKKKLFRSLELDS